MATSKQFEVSGTAAVLLTWIEMIKQIASYLIQCLHWRVGLN
jgi:hypothetical protein